MPAAFSGEEHKTTGSRLFWDNKCTGLLLCDAADTVVAVSLEPPADFLLFLIFKGKTPLSKLYHQPDSLQDFLSLALGQNT